MRLKRALAAFTAAVVAVTSIAVTPVVAGAAAVEKVPDGKEEVLGAFALDGNKYTHEFTGAWEDGGCISITNNDLEELAKDENVFVKLTASDIGTISTDDGETPFDTIIGWGWNGYSSWVGIAKMYKNWGEVDEYSVTFTPTPDSTSELAYSYVPLSDFKVSGTTLMGNFQAGAASKITVESVELVKFNTVEYETTTLNPTKNANGNEATLNIGTDLDLTKLSEDAKLRYTFTTTADGPSVTAGWGCGMVAYASESAPSWWESENQLVSISSPGPKTQGTIEVKCSKIPAEATQIVIQLYADKKDPNIINGTIDKVELLDVKSENPEPTTYSVTVADTTNGTVVADKTAEVAEGETVTLTVTPAENFELNTLDAATATVDVTVSPASAANKFTFVMPAADVTVYATFKAKMIKPAPKAEAGDGKVTLTWAAVPNATAYRVFSYKNDAYSIIDDCTGTSYTVTDLTNGTKYGFLVRACINEVWTEYTENDVVYATPYSTKPVVTATAGVGSVTLKWNAVTNATSYNVYSYEKGKFNVLASDCTDTSYTVTGLAGGTKYGFLVRSNVNGVLSSYSETDVVYATPVVAKPAVIAKADNGKVTLSWDAVSGATSYRVFSYLNGKYSVVTNCTDTSYTVTGLTNGTKYGFLVRAFANGVWSAYSTEDIVYVTPVAEKFNFAAKAGDGSVTLTWDAVSGATSYCVFSYLNGAYKVEKSNCTTTSYTVTGLTNGTKYGFLVRAYVNGKWTPYTTADNVYATPFSTKPVLTATAGNGSVSLKWNAVSGATQYRVFSYLNGKYKTEKASCTDTSYTVTGLTNDTKYGFLVRAYVNGAWSAYSTADNVYAVPGATKPYPTAKAGDGRVTLTWDAVPGATSYRVFSYLDGKYKIEKANCTATSYTVTGLTNDTKYGFLVRAYANGTWTPYSTADNVFATPYSTKPDVTATAGNGKVTLAWDAIPGASAYRVFSCLNGKYKIEESNCTETSYTVTGLTGGTKYGFLVRACVNGVWSPYTTSDNVYATPVVTKPNVTATVGDGKVTLAWDAIPDATSYRVFTYLNGTYTIAKSNCTDTSYTVTGLINGTKYGFLVRAYANGAWSAYSTADLVYATPNA